MIEDIDVARKMLSLKSSAASRGLEFNVSFRKMKSLMTRKKCFYTGIIFSTNQDDKYYRSIDRIDSSVGYIDSNIVACTVDINKKKANISVEEIKILATKLKNK